MESEAEALARFSLARVARMATVDGAGRPHIVPVVFAWCGDHIVTAVDHKPKRVRTLKRIVNVEGNPEVSILADHYDEDWTRLWWVRVDGVAAVSTTPPQGAAEALAAKYPQYEDRIPGGPWISVTRQVVRWWSGDRSSAASM